MSRYQKDKTKNQSGFTGARSSEWQWHLLGHMQICTSPQIAMQTSHHSVHVFMQSAIVVLHFGAFRFSKEAVTAVFVITIL